MAERSNAAVLKTVVPQGTGGSNPSFSAKATKEALENQGLLLFSFALLNFAPVLKKKKINYVIQKTTSPYKKCLTKFKD